MDPPPYVTIPEYATPLYQATPVDTLATESPRQPTLPRLSTASFPKSLPTNISSPIRSAPGSPATSGVLNFSGLALSQVLSSLPGPLPHQPRNATQGHQPLTSAKEPLSIPITSVNFKRFIARCGFVFWIQDRIEEIFLWRRGWKYTAAWMSGYTFLCFYPRMALLLPHASLLSILLTTYGRQYPDAGESSTERSVPPLVAQPGEETVDWFANLQAIQNLMGAISDAYDAAIPLLTHLTWTRSTTSPLFLATLLSFIFAIPLLPFIPLRPVFLCLGLFPFALTHPYILTTLPDLVRPIIPHLKLAVQNAVDKDNLWEKHWESQLKEVSVWENERWSQSQGWKSGNLRIGERRPWTRGQDGWSGVVEGNPFDGNVSSDLTFTLPSKWKFVETEDWRVDPIGGWSQVGSDEDGWVYTDDAWLDPRREPSSDWKITGMTRRRRWTRRIYAPV